MLNIENLNYAVGLRIDLDEHGDWECREAIEYQTDFSNQPEMFYRFELDNDDKDYELCIYLNRISDKGGFYTFENNLIGGSDYVPKNHIKDIHNFAEVIANYSRKVLDTYEKGF